MSKLKRKQESGITLIALVITIIVLLILAAVTIAMLTGENGILTKAITARDRTIEGQIKEEVGIAWNSVQIEGKIKGWNIDQKAQALETELQKEDSNANVTVSDNNLNVEYKGYEIVIDLSTNGIRIAGESNNGEQSGNGGGSNNENEQNEEPQLLSPGLYDLEGNLLKSWDALVRSGQLVRGNIEGEPSEDDEKCYVTINNESYLEHFYLDADKFDVDLFHLVIGEVEYIEADAFYYNENLSRVDIPDTVTTIDSNVFQGCTSLTSVTLPDSITWIGYAAFSGCTGLTSVTIPNLVDNIAYDAFQGCEGLTSITIPYANRAMTDIFNYSSLTSNTGNVSVTITGGNEICYEAFQNCEGLRSVTIPNSVTTIEGSAFAGCTNLGNLTFPNSLESIGYEAFYNCTSWTSINIPSSVTYIDNNAFAGFCGSSITIPQADYYGNKIFGESYESSIHDKDNGNVSVTITGGTSISDYFFDGCEGMTSVTLPNTLETIGMYAFNYCTNLNNVTIPESVESIAEDAFSDCSSFTSVTIPNNVSTIGQNAFGGCAKLTSITVPKADYNNITIYDIFYSGTLGSLFDENGNVSVTITGGTTIPDACFSGCYGMTSITLPDTINTIGEQAFNSCTGLTSITIPNSVETIGVMAFVRCTKLTSITIPSKVETIKWKTFEDCTELSTVTIPKSVTTIEDEAFNNCEKISTVNYNGTDKEWEAIDIWSGNEYLTDAYGN